MKKQVLVSVDRGETRVALLEAAGTPGASKRRGGVTADPGRGYRVAELYLERRGARSIVGNIYKGVVDNVLVGLEAPLAGKVRISLADEVEGAGKHDRGQAAEHDRRQNLREHVPLRLMQDLGISDR